MKKIKSLETCVLNRLLQINTTIRVKRKHPYSVIIDLNDLKDQRRSTDKLLSSVKKLNKSDFVQEVIEEEYKILLDQYLNAKIF